MADETKNPEAAEGAPWQLWRPTAVPPGWSRDLETAELVGPKGQTVTRALLSALPNIRSQGRPAIVAHWAGDFVRRLGIEPQDLYEPIPEGS
jgi:hypothetical protein